MSLARSTFLSRAVADPGLHRLNKLLCDVVISQGGVVPFINPEVRMRFFFQLALLLVRERGTWLTFVLFIVALAEQDAEGPEERRVTGGIRATDCLTFPTYLLDILS